MELTKEYFDEQLGQLTGKIVAMDTRITNIAMEVANIKEDTAVMRENMPSKELVEKMYQVGDKLATEVMGYRTEQVVAVSRTANIETWAKQVAHRVGVVFET